MVSRGFIEDINDVDTSVAWWFNLRVSSLELRAPLTVHPRVTIQEALNLLNREAFDQVPVVDDHGYALQLLLLVVHYLLTGKKFDILLGYT